MRRAKAPSEVGRMASPLVRLVDGAWRRMHWWVAAMAVLYALSGLTMVQPDEIAIVLRWGRLVGTLPALQQHGPGFLWALPRPIDEVVRVKVKRVEQLQVSVLASVDSFMSSTGTLDPIMVGYALTGDRNVVHVDMMARYRVSEPVAWAFYGPKVEDVLRSEVVAAMVRSLGEMGVDRVLSDGRKELIATATRRAQAGLDSAHAGIEIVSLELTALAPPAELAAAFDAVQSAYIGAETATKEAQAYAQDVVPRAHADADALVQRARADAATARANARGDADAFLALAREVRANPIVVRERLYRDAVERAIGGARSLRWVPPPSAGRYHGLRISIDPVRAGGPALSSPRPVPAVPMPQPPEGYEGQE